MAFRTLRKIGPALLAAPLLAAAPAPRIESIAMETNSRGTPVSSWRISSDGAGEYLYRRPVPGGSPDEADLVTKRFQVGREGFARIVELVGPVLRGREIGCGGNRTFDLPYGNISWQADGQARTISFDLGCRSGSARRAHEQLHDAERTIADWVRDGPEAGVRRISGRD